MCGAIDTTLSAICSGIVHSRVGACDPRGLFAKCVLHDDSHYTLGVTSLRPSSSKIWSIAELFPLPLSAKSKPTSATTYGKPEFVYVLDKRKRRANILIAFVPRCRPDLLNLSQERHIAPAGGRDLRREAFELRARTSPVRIRSRVADKIKVMEEPYEGPQ